jgi:hypothetical protein
MLGRKEAMNRSIDVRRGSVVWSLRRGGEAVEGRCVREKGDCVT